MSDTQEAPAQAIATVRAYRSYTDEEKALALETVNACGGNIAEAARRLGLSREVVREWTKGHGVPLHVFADFAAKKPGIVAAKLQALADRLIDALADEDKIENARLSELATTFGIVFDKIRLNDGSATQIIENRQVVTPDQAVTALKRLLELGATQQEALEMLSKSSPTLAKALPADWQNAVDGVLVEDSEVTE